jgi:CheY-like chemotaxis protein
MGNKLLLADDSITIQKVVAIIFANEEFELTVVDNGVAALEKAREIQPDVMLVDALMPGKTGYEVCADIRRDPVLSSVPTLLLIGAFEPLDEEKARDCGADATITKPFESQQLIDRVKELLALGKSRSAAPAKPQPIQAPPVELPVEPPPVESAAEELWGDLSSFDTMPPVAAPPAFTAPAAAAPAYTAPAAPAYTAPAAPAYTAPAAPAAAPVVEAAAPAPAYAAPSQPVAAPVAEEEIVEASYEDDLWGAFDVEDAAPIEEPASPADVFGVLEPDSEFEAEEFFSFEDESEAIAETGPALNLAETVAQPAFNAPIEDFSTTDNKFNLGEELPLAPVSEPEPEPFQLPEHDVFSFEPEEPAQPVAPVAPAAAAAAPVQPQPEPVAAPQPQSAPAQPAAATLSEADLIAALSRVSKEVIERIVWEVVPDLAEVLIKEEIRKLKAGIRG